MITIDDIRKAYPEQTANMDDAEVQRLMERGMIGMWQDEINKTVEGWQSGFQRLLFPAFPIAPLTEAKPESEAPKDEKPKTRKTINIPKSKAPLRKWALLWEFNDKYYELQKFNAKQFRLEFELYDKFDKPKWIPQDDETLQAILDYGRAGKIPKHDSIE